MNVRALVGLTSLLAVAMTAQAEPFGPFRTPAAPVTREAREAPKHVETLPSGNPYAFAFRVYQVTLSSQDGPHCMHYPTCSAYGVQAVRRHPFLGFFLTADRLWRDGTSSRLRLLPAMNFHGVVRAYDPVDANDFWLRGLDAMSVGEAQPPRVRQ